MMTLNSSIATNVNNMSMIGIGVNNINKANSSYSMVGGSGAGFTSN
jgi:hypothetical protein